jgi:dethiobiotin synthetase
MGYIQKLDIPFLYKLVIKGFEEKQKAEDYQLYCSIFPHYDKKTVVSFSEFRNKLRPEVVKVAMKSKNDIMNELLGGVSNRTI